MSGVEDTDDIGSRVISLADATGKVMCHIWSLVHFTSLHPCKDQPVAAV